MKYFSTFSGIGGFEIGIQNAWMRIKDEGQTIQGSQTGNTQRQFKQLHQHGNERLSCVGYSEIDKYAISVYERQFNGHKNYGDITKINADELPDFECLVGGFPCQAFSIAGKRRGFEDTRGTLFFDLARILKTKKPRLFVFENVKGLLSHDNGNTFKTIIATIDELGYDCQWQVLNSKNHGVPQNRERIIIVGHLRGTARPEVFPIRETNSKDIVQLNYPTHSNDRVYDTEGISPTLNTMQGGLRQPFIQNPKMMNYKKDYENSVAITATSYKEPPVVNSIRRLTPIECERLQAFPDNWTKYGRCKSCDAEGYTCMDFDNEISDSQRYKMCGNAVTVNVIRDVFEKIFNTKETTL